MITKISPKFYLIFLLIFSSLISSCQQDSDARQAFEPISLRSQNTKTNTRKTASTQYSKKQLAKAKKLADRGQEEGENGDLNTALKFTEKALKVFPGYARAYYNRGYAREQLEDIQGALADYTKAIELYPDNLSSPLILQYAYQNRGSLRHNLDDDLGAIADANKALELAPDDGGIYANRGLAYAALENYQAAIADQTRAIELEPNVPGWYFNRGKIHRQAGDYQKALADLDRAISLNPNFSWAYVQWCNLLLTNL